MGSDVFTVVNSNFWEPNSPWDHSSSLLLALSVVLEPLGPTTDWQAGCLPSFLPSFASKVEDHLDHISSYPISPECVELGIFTEGSGRANGGSSPCIHSSWVHPLVDPSLCYPQEELGAGGVGCPGSLQMDIMDIL